jgi:MFS family permease
MISKAINAKSVQAVWIGSSYFLSSIVFQPIIASLSHIFGRKPITVGALLIFIIGTIICSVAQNVAALLAGRTIQGIGCGGNYVMIDILITDLVPLRQRGSYLGFVSLAWTFGSTIGPVMGASFAQRVTWRWIFWIMVPL